MQADQYIPFPMDEVSYDFEVLGPNDKDPESSDVLLVATRTENVEQRQAAVKAAGLTAKIVDVEAFALENACKLMTHQMPDGGIDRTIAVVDFGASSTTFSVLRNMKVVYTRNFAFGGQQLTEEIMRTYGLAMEEAGRAKKEGGLPGNYQAEVLDPFIDDMTQQVSRSLQFYLASGSGPEQPEKILVALGVAALAAGVTAFAAYLLYGSMIESQELRNAQLRTEIKTLDKQIEEINNLEVAKQKFIARMEIIEKLQRSRPEIVHVFDEIVRTLPEGVYLTGVKQTEKRLRFDGVAQSSTRVSSFMRNLD